VADHEHVYADLTPVIHRPVRPPAARLTALAGKLLFGSDAPNTGLTVTQLLDGLDGSGLPAEAWAALTGGTARRLVGDVRSDHIAAGDLQPPRISATSAASRAVRRPSGSRCGFTSVMTRPPNASLPANTRRQATASA